MRNAAKSWSAKRESKGKLPTPVVLFSLSSVFGQVQHQRSESSMSGDWQSGGWCLASFRLQLPAFVPSVHRLGCTAAPGAAALAVLARVPSGLTSTFAQGGVTLPADPRVGGLGRRREGRKHLVPLFDACSPGLTNIRHDVPSRRLCPCWPRSVVKVLGPEFSVATIREANVASVKAELMVNGVPKSEGTGAEVKGSPASSLCWLANQGVGLKAGQLVITGAFCKWKSYAAGDQIIATFDGLGEVILNLAPPTTAATVPATVPAAAPATAASAAGAEEGGDDDDDDDGGGGLAALFGDDLDEDDESDGDFEAGEEEEDVDIDDASDNDDDVPSGGGGPSAAKKARVD